jgi:hypothetical protein
MRFVLQAAMERVTVLEVRFDCDLGSNRAYL